MPVSNYVTVSITRETLGVPRASFGVPMILSHSNSSDSWDVGESRIYSSLSGVEADFPILTGPEYRAAVAMFSQPTRVPKIVIGRGANKPTQAYSLAFTAANSKVYSLRVSGEGVTETTVSYTSDASATLAEIAGGLVAALNGVVGANYLAAGASSPITITASDPGDWFSVEIISGPGMEIEQTHADPGVAADLSAILTNRHGWYALDTHYNSNAYVLAAAAWAEANQKLYAAATNETKAKTVAAGAGTDTGDDLKTLNRDKTVCLYSAAPDHMLSSAMLGLMLPSDPGTETWAHKRPVGVPYSKLTDTQRANLEDKNILFYENAADGLNVTWEGKVASGEWIDTIRLIDNVYDEVSKRVLEVISGPLKLPFTDLGISAIEGAVRGAMGAFEARGAIDSGWTVSAPLLGDVPTIDRANRILREVEFSCRVSGAIHKADIRGKVSV